MLAILLACHDSYHSSMWDGKDEADNFRKHFKAFCEGLPDEVRCQISIEMKKLGNHTPRKGTSPPLLL